MRQGRIYIYAKTQLRTYLGQNMGRFYRSSDGFLIGRINITNFFKSECVMMLESPPHSYASFDDLSPISAK